MSTPDSAVLSLSTPYKLARSFGEGQTVVFTSTILNTIAPPSDKTMIIITNGADYLISISLDRLKQEISMNTKLDGKWGSPSETISMYGAFSGGFPTIAISNTGSTFLVSFDNQKAYSFVQRSPKVGTGLLYQGSKEPNGILFSDPVYANIYSAPLRNLPLIAKS
jgi:hypothetical protein